MKKNDSFFKNVFRKANLLLAIGLTFTTSLSSQNLSDGLKLHYTFESTTETTVPDVSGNGYNGTLSGATIGMSNGKNSLILGTTGTAFLDMGASTGNLVASLTDFSMSCYVWVNSTYTTLGNNGNMIATFANSLDSYGTSNGYMFLQAKRSRYAITTVRYETEQAVQTGTDVVKGRWVHFAYTQTGTTGKLYVDGVLKNTNINVTLTPSSLGATPYNMLAKPSYTGDKYLQDSQLSDFRIYNRALTTDEVLMLNGYPAELIAAYNGLTLSGDLTQVKADINLPATSAGVPITWTSSLPNVISTTGNVLRPELYDTTVKLTGTMQVTVNGVTYTLKKDFTAIVIAINVASEQVAQWDFSGSTITESNGVVKVKDLQSGFVGTIMNDASIRTIGNTEKYNVLDLGNGTGYFDMGTEIGKAIYSLNDYTMFGYFRIDDDYAEIGNNGNFIWTFSNTADAPTDKNGYIIGHLNAQIHEVSSSFWQVGNQAVSVGTPATKGGWHHFAFSQKGDVGTIYVDGMQMAQNTSFTNKPSITLPIDGRTGTLYNWLGRACYPTDAYLRKTLLYDFQLLRSAFNSEDLITIFEVPSTIDKLNNAYGENPNYTYPELTTEMDGLNLGDLTALTSNISLPTKGVLDPAISISWKSTNDSIISSAGVVNRQNYFPYNATLTATFTKNGQKVTKSYPATVLAKENSQFTSDLLLKLDFQHVSDSIVTDVAEKQLKTTLKNDAKVMTMGTSTQFKVLNLGDSIGYLDLGAEVGKLMYNLTDYTVGAYYRIHEGYTNIAANGNFLFTFSNTKDAMADASGYIIGSLKDQRLSITPGNYAAATGNQSAGFGTAALQGNWHHFAYTQSGNIGTVYIDGMPLAISDITITPSTALPKANKLGTAYNWIGRSNYTTDAYLRQTLVSDFRIYKKALTDDEIQSSVLSVANTINALEVAYLEGLSAVGSISTSNFKVIAMKGGMKIQGLNATDKVTVFDIAGRKLQVTNSATISANAGVYIVKINNFVTKVIVN